MRRFASTGDVEDVIVDCDNSKKARGGTGVGNGGASPKSSSSPSTSGGARGARSFDYALFGSELAVYMCFAFALLFLTASASIWNPAEF